MLDILDILLLCIPEDGEDFLVADQVKRDGLGATFFEGRRNSPKDRAGSLTRFVPGLNLLLG